MTGQRIEAMRTATAEQDPPFGVLDQAALDANAADLVIRAAGTPIRLATKSVRVRELIRATLARPGFAGLLAYTLPEALWLADKGFDDTVVGYPSVSRPAIAALASGPADTITVMIDDAAQLDLIDDVVSPSRRPDIRVALELDAAYRPGHGLAHLGTRRSPLHSPADVLRLAREVTRRRGFRLVGMMAYEGQIAGVGNAGRGPRAMAVRAMQRASAAELATRRSVAIAGVRDLADLEFVNGGGTGSIETTRAEPEVTEIAAGSGLLGPGLFDHYRAFAPAPASYFVLPVVRRPARNMVTVLGGGWIASGPIGADRVPVVAHPPGLRYVGAEGAGEVQTPLRGRAARSLELGDQVWFRHAKAGEPAEHLNEYLVVAEGKVVERWPTYRGEGQAFL